MIRHDVELISNKGDFIQTKDVQIRRRDLLA